MGIADRAMRALLIVGGLNWLMVAAGKFDLVAVLTRRRFGTPSIATRTLYGLIGGAALLDAVEVDSGGSVWRRGSRPAHRQTSA